MAQRPKTQPIPQTRATPRLPNPNVRKYGAWAWFGLVLLGLAVIPTIYSGLLVSSVKDPLGNLERVPAAVVNLDQPAASQDATIRLGQDLVSGLISPDPQRQDSFGWRPLGAPEAREALASGEVQAVLTIPEGFSANAVALSTGEDAEATPSTLRVQTNDGSGTVMGPIAAAVGETVASTVAEGIGEQYVHNLLMGFTTVRGGMREAADGATRLTGGVQEATTGAEDLVIGLDRLVEGISTLHTGAARMASGTAAAGRASQDLAAGTAGVDDGARQLSASLSGIQQRTTSLPGQAAELADGAARVADGLGDMSSGAARLEMAAGTMAARVEPFVAGLDEAVSLAQRLRDGTKELAAGTAELQGTSARMRSGIDDLLTGYDSMSEEQRQVALGMLADDAGQLVDAAGRSAEEAASVDARVGGLMGNVSAGTGLSALQDGTRQVADGASAASAEITALADQVHTLSDGADQVATGTRGLATGSRTLADGIDRASSGAKTLATGASELDMGARELAGRMPGLATGATDIESGSAKLSSGIAAAKDGMHGVATGLGELSGHSGGLAESLRAGADEVPAYSDQEAADLAAVAVAPVSTQAEKLNEVPSVGYGLAAYFMALALWVGALGYFFTRPALHLASLEQGGSVAGAAVRSIALPAAVSVVQSLLMVAVMVVVLDGQVANGWGLAGMALLTSLTFFAINQALMALFGAPGQFIAPLMMVVQLAASGGMYPIETAPAAFQAIHPWLPMTYALESFRSLIAGGSIGIDRGIVVLCAYLAVSGVLLLAAVWFRGRAVRSAARTVLAVADPATPRAEAVPVKPRALAAR